MNRFFSLERIAAKARQAAADGAVLLENQNETLPLKQGDRVALFGRIAFHYYKSGLGSGGLVNARYVVGIYDALAAEPGITLDQELIQVYRNWELENPYDNGTGWGQVPWSQREMPVTEELAAAAAERCDAAVVVIGRTAGEDQDIRNAPGSYLLTDTEEDLVRKVCAHFRRAVVVLNVGNPIDMSWVASCHVPAVLYTWQGGQEGGNGVADVLTGRVCPGGRLTDTIAASIADYPSTHNFGDPKRNIYQEDIYVGYRFFETFARDKVLYPFGYGLSYTRFLVDAAFTESDDSIEVTARVRNAGACRGRHSVLVYIEAPQGQLGKPARVLAGFGKTALLEPGAAQTLTLQVPKARFASFDDSGASGCRNAFVLEAGSYRVYVGGDVRSAACAGCWEQAFRVIERCEEAMAPIEAFARIRPAADRDGYRLTYEQVPTRTIDPLQRRLADLPEELPQAGDQGWKLRDVYAGAVSLDTFLAQLSDEDLICLFRGEGMCSPKVTPGTASAFGGVTDRLRGFGIPIACCADGPSGIRMDCGTPAFSLPNGVLLGATFDTELVQELFAELGLELRKNRIDTLLGPGMNIHRSPLNGRNFEYFSEDPLLTGLMGAAQLRGMHTAGVTGTIKHFCGNNQEFKRHEANSVISQRALREIYLRGFGYAVKEGSCRAIMTTYGPVNGIWTAGCIDMNTRILREEWGFDGIVMTDWWAKGNWEGGPAAPTTRAPMVAAQNDLFMVVSHAEDMTQDDLAAALAEGRIHRSELQRCARNVLRFLLRSLAMQYEMNAISAEELAANRSDEADVAAEVKYYCTADPETGIISLPADQWVVRRGISETCAITLPGVGKYELVFTVQSDLGPLAQLPVSIYFDNILSRTITFHGLEGRTEEVVLPMGMIRQENHYVKFFFGNSGLNLRGVQIRRMPEA